MKRRPRIIIASLFAAIFSGTVAMANQPGNPNSWTTYQSHEEGWWWYKDPIELIDIEEESEPELELRTQDEQPKQDSSQANVVGPDVFSVQWLREQMPVLLDQAIDNPTKENIERYEYAKRITLDKAQTYAERTRDVVINDPFLDENNRVPLATFAKTALFNSQTNELDKALTYLSGKAGIWMFFDSSCDFCHTQVGSIQKLHDEYGFETMYISVDGQGMPMLEEWYLDEGQAKGLGLSITPTTALVVPPNQVFVISQGAMAYDQLQERILLAANSNELLPEEYQKGLHVFNQGLITADELAAGENEVDWLKALKGRLQARHE